MSKGQQAFQEFYSQMYGERWESLSAALRNPVKQIARLNKWAEPALKEQIESELAPVEGFPTCRELPSERLIPADSKGLKVYYAMDLASLLAPQALGVQASDRVLDLCAAPGGKSLILFESLGAEGELVANEMSKERKSRLQRVFREYIPESERSRLSVASHDGTRWCLYETEAFDRILVDAPCSGERHLLENATELSQWSKARSKNLSVRQHALLASAVQVVKPGGRIVYSTCSISRLENDGVIEKLLKKRSDIVTVVPFSSTLGEPTQYGWQILPDRTGFGPLFICVLEKKTSP